jgi:addiction module RelE/StbE family toxin
VRTFSRTSQFKKDVKRTEKRGKDMVKLKAAFERLIDGEPLAAEFKDHPLRGNFWRQPGLPYRAGLGADLHAHRKRHARPL